MCRLKMWIALATAGVCSSTLAVPPRTDLHGDPLPPGALVRLGTIRLRHLNAVVAFSPDGKTLISAGPDGTIRHWDPATGKEVRRVRVHSEGSSAYPQILAPNGNTVAGMVAKDIAVWDMTTGEELRRFPIGKDSAPGGGELQIQVWRIALSPDGKLLAAVLHGLGNRDIHVWEIRSGKKLSRMKRRLPTDAIAFSPDGKLLASVFQDGARLWDTKTGEEVRKIDGAAFCLVFSPNGARLATGSPDGGVKVWNVADSKECFAIKRAPDRFLSILSFGPDNKTLAVGAFGIESSIWDIAARKRVVTIPTLAGHLVFSPAGKTVASISGNAIHFWDAASGKEIAPRAGHNGSVSSLAIAPHEATVATFSISDRVARVWETASGRPLLGVTAHRHYVGAGAFSPDGRLLITGGGDNILRAWDRKSGEEARRFIVESADPIRENLQIRTVAVSSDGERLACITVGGDFTPANQVVVWEFKSGKRLVQRPMTHPAFTMQFAPDAQSIAKQSAETIIIEDTISGRDIQKMTGRGPMAYSPDGRILATTLYTLRPPPPGQGGFFGEPEAIELTELASGKRLARIEAGRKGFGLLTYSPDGRTLAAADVEGFQLWDVATGTEIHRQSLPNPIPHFSVSFAESLAFFPGSGKLATGLRDSTVLIWDIEPAKRRKPAAKDHDASDLERFWADLAGDDAEKAHRAVWALAVTPTKSIPFLKERLRRATAPDARHIERLISDLDSAEFSVRETAGEKLRGFGEQAEPPLRRALQGEPSLEARKRLDSLHADAVLAGRGVVHSKEVLRTLRSIRALEALGTSEARQVLATLARGDPAARVTRQAKEALLRLDAGR